jgi:hypothetical protein
MTSRTGFRGSGTIDPSAASDPLDANLLVLISSRRHWEVSGQGRRSLSATADRFAHYSDIRCGASRAMADATGRGDLAVSKSPTHSAAWAKYVSRMTAGVFAPARLGPIALRNRIIKAATFEGRTPKRVVTPELIEFHRRFAAGGVGMSTVAYCAVTRAGTTDGHQIVLDDPEVSVGQHDRRCARRVLDRGEHPVRGDARSRRLPRCDHAHRW